MRSLLLSAIVTGCVLSSALEATAQGNSPSANATRYGTAVVDVSYIFKNYSQFTSAMKGLKSEMEQIDSDLKSERAAIASKEEQRKTLNPGSPDHNKLDEEIARATADFQIKAGRIRKQFLEKEAKVYYQTYLQVSNAVQHYAQSHNIGLVLRFNGDQIDPNQREKILHAINKPVVYQNNIDITPDVLALLNRGGAPGGLAPTANGQQTTRR